MLDVNKREQPAEEEVEEVEMKEEKEEVIENKEAPKYVPSARDNDEGTKTIAKGLFDKMFSVEEEYDAPVEVESVMVRNDDDYTFDSSGDENKLSISPYDGLERYNIEIKDSDNNLIHTIPNVQGNYMARMNFIKGQYKVHIKSKSNMTALIKLS